MCKAHFHPFAVIISPFHAVEMQWGVKIYTKKYFFFSPNPLGTKCPGENTAYYTVDLDTSFTNKLLVFGFYDKDKVACHCRPGDDLKWTITSTSTTFEKNA
jgi:hypothetical protein